MQIFNFDVMLNVYLMFNSLTYIFLKMMCQTGVFYSSFSKGIKSAITNYYIQVTCMVLNFLLFEGNEQIHLHETQSCFYLFQVKNYKNFRKNWGPKDTFTCLNMSPDVLGQHGIELLLEMDQSLFKPTIYGCICIGSYVIYIF